MRRFIKYSVKRFRNIWKIACMALSLHRFLTESTKVWTMV